MKVFPLISTLFFTSRETFSMEISGHFLSTSIRLRGLAYETYDHKRYRGAKSCNLRLNHPYFLNTYTMKNRPLIATQLIACWSGKGQQDRIRYSYVPMFTFYPSPWLTGTLGYVISYFGHNVSQIKLLSKVFADYLPHRSIVRLSYEAFVKQSKGIKC